MDLTKRLQYIWLRAVPFRRIIDYIGAIEGTLQYRHIRTSSSGQYERFCQAAPPLVKANGIDVIFRTFITSHFGNESFYALFKEGKDPVMVERVEQAMGSSIPHLAVKAAQAWIKKWTVDGKRAILNRLKKIKWRLKSLPLQQLSDDLNKCDYQCVLISGKFEKAFGRYHDEAFNSLCQNGLKPLFVLLSNQYSLTAKGGGFILEVPQYARLPLRLSKADRMLFGQIKAWINGFALPQAIRSKIIRSLRREYFQYLSMRAFAERILNDKAACLISFIEHQYSFNTFIFQAKKRRCPTVYFYPVLGIHETLHDHYNSDFALVTNRVTERKFKEIGFSDDRCRAIGSFDFKENTHVRQPREKGSPLRIVYFSKDVITINEAILHELDEKLSAMKVAYELVIKKHPRDAGLYERFAKKGALITFDSDIMKYILKSDLVITQYGGVIFQTLSLGIPLILYTYSDILEYGERRYFQGAQLPNYFKYVQNKEQFQRAIEQLMDIKEAEPLSDRLVEDLFGYRDQRCGSRLAAFIKELMHDQKVDAEDQEHLQQPLR